MNRHGNLWPQIVSFDNLLAASRQAQRSKRYRDNVLEFNDQLEPNLLQLQFQLRDHTYQPGAYRTFEIFEPKPRMISAAPYRDRVVHHALCAIIAPIFDRTFIADSYANRKGYGSHRALRRFTAFCRTNPYILSCDIRKYFPSVDQAILKSLIRRKIKCPDTLWLIDSIIDNSHYEDTLLSYFPGDNLFTPLERKRGLPIGNLTSQFFANFYLNGLDHYIKETLQAKCYVRYLDDFSIFSADQSFLVAANLGIENYLFTLRLQLHPLKSQLFETRQGANFLGFRVLSTGTTFPKAVYLRVRNDNLRRARSRFKRLYRALAQGHPIADRIAASRQSWLAHLAHGNTWRLRQRILVASDRSIISIKPKVITKNNVDISSLGAVAQ
jgi:RNA-directed DNA polymerase